MSATADALSELTRNPENVFVCSTDSPGYDLTLSLLAYYDNPLKLILPNTTSLKEIIRQYGISPERIRDCKQLVVDSRSFTGFRLRDELVIQTANQLYPISLRETGFFATRIAEDSDLQNKSNSKFVVKHQLSAKTIKREYQKLDISKQTNLALQKYLIHWTKETNSPWPSETVGDYYRALFQAPVYPRSAIATLRRIASEKLLRGSDRNLCKNSSAVAFSSANISDALALMNYRSRANQMAFEPYGVAIPRNLAMESGIEQVNYVTNSEFQDLSPSQRTRAHSLGVGGQQWDVEREWRALGDIQLGRIWDKLIWLTPTRIEAEALQDEYNIRAKSVFEENCELNYAKRGEVDSA